MITIVPEGGLCNRMRAVAAARLFAKAADTALTVHWYRTPDLNARFERLFQTDDLDFRVSERYAMLGIVRSGVRQLEGAMTKLGRPVVRGADATPDHFDVGQMVALARQKDVYVRSFARFMAAPDMFDMFRPAAQQAAMVARLAPRLGQSVGVHIRRTDNEKAIAQSPLSAFVEHMDRERLLDPSVNFFVATDEPSVFRTLRDRYGEGVFEHQKSSLRRDKPRAADDAVVDLYALSQCRKLIGSYWSSFSETAAAIRGIDRVIAGVSTSR